MKIKTVSYSQSKETMYGFGLKVWNKAGVEIELDEKDKPENAFAMAKQLVNEQLQTTSHEEPIVQKERPKDTKEELIFDIGTCTDLKVLESYEFLSKKYPEIMEAYNQKHKELSNGSN